MKVCVKYKVCCDSCQRESKESDFIELSANETGITNDEYEIHFCDLICMKVELDRLRSEYSNSERDDMSYYYVIKEYLHNKLNN